MTERWLPVVGFEGLYEVSDLGRIRNSSGQIFRCGPNKQGYPKVTLHKNNKPHQFLVHVLVLTAFEGPKPDGCETCHKNHNRGDARLENLRWGTPTENKQEILRADRFPSAKLTLAQVRHLRTRTWERGDIPRLARQLGVSELTIQNVKSGRTFKHV